jgi:hypothetical protein
MTSCINLIPKGQLSLIYVDKETSMTSSKILNGAQPSPQWEQKQLHSLILCVKMARQVSAHSSYQILRERTLTQRKIWFQGILSRRANHVTTPQQEKWLASIMRKISLSLDCWLHGGCSVKQR